MKHIEGHTNLVSGTAVSAAQYALAQEIIKMFKGERKLRRNQIKAAHKELRGALASPYFIVKNKACKTEERGVYNLGVLRPAAVKVKREVEAGDPPAPRKGKSKALVLTAAAA